jgi:fido (protein-threonine AMPylation protein)
MSRLGRVALDRIQSADTALPALQPARLRPPPPSPRLPALNRARLVQLIDRPPKPTGDLTELRAIHRQLFQDLCDWAGQIRTDFGEYWR